MAKSRAVGVSGRDHFAELYLNELDLEVEWLRRGAADKADTVEQLLARNGFAPTTLTELGAGTGAVISECRRRGLAKIFAAIDYAPAAVDYLKKNVQGVTVMRADITSPDFRLDKPIDVLVISHVVEHLEHPKVFLEAVRSNIDFKVAIIEVPLEDLLLAKFKALIKPRKNNAAGHVQFFTAKSFERLVASARFKIVDRRLYLPIPSVDTLRFVHAKDDLPTWRLPLMWITRRLIPLFARSLWSRLYYCHHAVLVVPA